MDLVPELWGAFFPGLRMRVYIMVCLTRLLFTKLVSPSSAVAVHVERVRPGISPTSLSPRRSSASKHTRSRGRAAAGRKKKKENPGFIKVQHISVLHFSCATLARLFDRFFSFITLYVVRFFVDFGAPFWFISL